MFSNPVSVGYVPIADNIGERIYMLQFDEKLPAWAARWQPTVDAMLKEITLGGPQFLMVDQGFVKQGQTLRRPGAHVDGFWQPGIQTHGGGWKNPGRHRHRGGGHVLFEGRTELLILASDVPACRFYEGEYDGIFGEGGDASQIQTQHLNSFIGTPNEAYAGDTGQLLHESIPQERDSFRTVVRLNCYNASIH